ncbi:MAG TPA: recombinase family protein [Ktedonobacteraceae bacterium]|nr:recombinase family protein [Ktedonobacteraceae bacterium]
MRKFQSPEEKPEQKKEFVRFGPKPLPLSFLVGIYARQSTKGQVANHSESTEMQTVDLIALAKRLGWENDEEIILFIENIHKDGKVRNASGRLRIDQREGLKTLVDRIEADEIKAVIVAYEDRLFRDETQIQVNVFIDVCKRHNTFVITPYRRYDFHDPLDCQMFRMRCEQAAAFLHDYVERLHDCRDKVSLRGEYDGRAISIGFIVDRRKKISKEGQEIDNPGYKKFIPYEPHAKVVKWIFRRYRELGGNLSALCKEVKLMPVVFPPFGEEVDPRDIRKCGSLAVEGGYRPTRVGLIGILTNVVYIGYWVFENVVISKNNHAAIVDEEDFWYAFNRLSDYTPDGEENHRQKQSRQAREVSPSNTALLLERITSDIGPVYIVGTNRGVHYYAASEKDARYGLKYQTACPIPDIDSLAVEKLLEHLETETGLEDYRRHAAAAQEKVEQAMKLLEAQLRETDQQIAGYKASLALAPDELDEETRREFAKKLKVLRGVREEIEKKRHQTQQEEGLSGLLAYDELIQEMRKYWPQLPFADKKRLVQAFLIRAVMRECAPHWLYIEFEWRTPSWGIDNALMWRASGSSPNWTDEESAILREHFPKSDRLTLQELLPNRTYRAIYYQSVRALELQPRKIPNNTPFGREISLCDYQFMQECGLVYDRAWGSKKVFWSV